MHAFKKSPREFPRNILLQVQGNPPPHTCVMNIVLISPDFLVLLYRSSRRKQHLKGNFICSHHDYEYRYVCVYVAYTLQLFNILTADRPPKLSELQRLTLDPDVCCKWEDVGIALGLADEDDGAYLEELANIENGGDKKRMWLVFKKWLPVSKNKLPQTCSWKYLLQILKTHDLHGAADTMRDHLGKTIIAYLKHLLNLIDCV